MRKPAPPLSCNQCAIGAHSFYGELMASSPGTVTGLRTRLCGFTAGQHVIRVGAVKTPVFTIFSGWAYKFQTMRNGHRHVLAFFMPGDFLLPELLTESIPSHGVRAATDMSACAFDREAFVAEMRRSPELSARYCQRMIADFHEVEAQLCAVAGLPAGARVAQFLALLGERMQSRAPEEGMPLRLPLAQSLIADALGLTTVYLNRILGSLRDQGLVSTEREGVLILDLPGLADRAREQ